MTIDYTYDPLYRLTAADYSNGDFYHYTYDAVGNRLTSSDQLSVNSYQYDAANRLSSVDGVNYAFDDNGNLLSDGVNTYVYDSANRLISVNNTETYTYNGLGDRLTQNGTQYILDLNAGLTQVLNDGTNSYLYGNGRISQTGSVIEYFLGDALGSVRQLTDTSGEITLAKSYDPYGNVTLSSGNRRSPFAYTGEQQDASGLTYLRARYYSSGDGRFLSRDTWGGDYNNPLSLNRWGYVEGNPVNFTDSTGNFPTLPTENCSTPAKRVATAKKYVSRGGELSTYTAAAIAVQCFGIYQDIVKNEDANDGQGIGQISDNQGSTKWGDSIGKPGKPGFGGHGLLCYIVRRAISDTICVCDTEDNIKELYPGSKYQLEQPRPLTDSAWSAELMRRRIKIVLDKCNDNLMCTDTDRFIIAGLAQNGSGFTIENMKYIKNNFLDNTGHIDWYSFLLDQNPGERSHLVTISKHFEGI